MDSSKIINVNTVDLAAIDLTAFRAESLAIIEKMQTQLSEKLDEDIVTIRERIDKSFRQFLLDKEQERMPFMQRVMTAHLENMEDERGFPPRHPIHWFKSKLEFSSTGILEFDFKKEAELFMDSALQQIESEIKDSLRAKQQENIDRVNSTIRELQQYISTKIQPIALAQRIISSEYVNSYIQTDRLNLRAVEVFYFASMGARFDAKKELIYSEVCVRPTGILSGGKDNNKPTQLKYAISCDRLLDVVAESISRSVKQIDTRTQAYLSKELTARIDALFQGLVSG